MTRKRVVPREEAERDINEAIAHYRTEGGAPTALGFIDALEAAFDHLGAHPATGSPRYASELDLPGLRHWPIRNFPYLIFYVELEGHLDVWRMLHSQRDIPAWLQPEAF